MNNLSYQDLGALLIAVGLVMGRHNLCAAAALDGNSDAELIAIMEENGIDRERAELLLETDLSTAIEFIKA